jgi:hypothetical protein
MSIFVIMLLLRGGNTLNLIYSAEDRARRDFRKLGEACASGAPLDVEFSDDFGTEAHINVETIAVRTLQNIARVQDGAGEMQLTQLRTQVKLQNKAKDDPVLKFAATMQRPGLMS